MGGGEVKGDGSEEAIIGGGEHWKGEETGRTAALDLLEDVVAIDGGGGGGGREIIQKGP